MEDQQKPELETAKENFAAQESAVESETSEMAESMKSYEDSVASRMTAVADQAADRRKVLRQTENFNRGLQMMVAKLLQNSIQLLVSMMQKGREEMVKKKAMISATG